MHKSNNENKYKIIADFMDGDYVRIGLVLCEDDNENQGTSYMELDNIDKIDVKHSIKEKFGLDFEIENIKIFVFTHYT